MDLKEEFVNLISKQGIEIEREKGGGKVIYKVNGNLLYITFSKNLGTEKEEKYFLQINEKKLKKFSKQDLFILLICGSLDNCFVIPRMDFLDMVKNYKPAKDGNWKINIVGRREVTKIQEEYKIKLGSYVFSLIPYKNKFENLKTKEETVKKIVFTIQNIRQYRLKEITKPEVIYKIQLKREKIFDLLPEKIVQVAKSGEGKKFERIVCLFFKYIGFDIDDETSGKPGELDIICVSPLRIGIECRSTVKSVGVDIIDELKRHVRRYEEKNKYKKGIFKRLIICEDTTKQFGEDCRTEKCYSLRVSTFVKLVTLASKYPFSPVEFQEFFVEYGQIDQRVESFVNEIERKIKLRETVIEVFKEKNRPLKFDEIKVLCEVRGFTEEELDKGLNNILIEFASPLINILKAKNEKYIFIKSQYNPYVTKELQKILR